MVERYPAGDDGPAPIDGDSQASAGGAKSRVEVFAASILVLITFLTLSNVCDADFVVWDDPINVTANPYINPVSPAHLLHLWTHPYQKLYIPVAYTAYAAVAMLSRLHGQETPLRPLPFHLASLVLHILNTLLVFFLLRRWLLARPQPSPAVDDAANIPSEGRSVLLPGVVDARVFGPKTGRVLGPLAGALLFGVHPIQVETVAWISELRGALAMTLACSPSTDTPDVWSTRALAQTPSPEPFSSRWRHSPSRASSGTR